MGDECLCILAGNVSLSTAIVTDVSTPATRGKEMAMIGVAFSLGFLFGPMIGAAFSMWGKTQAGECYMYPAVFALILSIVDVFFLAVQVCQPHQPGEEAAQ